MKLRSRSATGRRSVMAAFAALAVGVGTLAGPAHADAGRSGPGSRRGPIDCPAPVPAADIEPDMVGEGWTVVRGSTPEPFGVKVLGVLTDGIGAGRDMVMIEVSDLAGRPCGRRPWHLGRYVGFAGVCRRQAARRRLVRLHQRTRRPIGGLTPAADMMKLLGVSARPRRRRRPGRPGPRSLSLRTRRRPSTPAPAQRFRARPSSGCGPRCRSADSAPSGGPACSTSSTPPDDR